MALELARLLLHWARPLQTDGLAVGLGAYALASSAGNFGAGFSQLGAAITGNAEGGEQGAQASAVAVSVLGIGALLVTKGDVNAAATAAQIEGIATVPVGMGLTGETPSLPHLRDRGQNSYELIKKNPKSDMAKGSVLRVARSEMPYAF